MLTERGILCKVNSVMIPGVNDKHLVEVNKAVKSRGAFLHNIMPLISAPEHGTVFGLTGQRGPTAQELKALQDSCEGEMNMMRHCRQCRADAVGLLGEDRSAEFTTDKIMAMEVELRSRHAARPIRPRSRRSASPRSRPSRRSWRRSPARRSDIKLLVAVATKGSGLINEHFGHAKEFQIYELSHRGRQVRRPSPRRSLLPGRLRRRGQPGDRDPRDQRLPCGVRGQDRRLPEGRSAAKAGIEPVDEYAHEFIEKSAIAWFKAYLDKVNSGEIVHDVRGDAEIRQGALHRGRLNDRSRQTEEMIDDLENHRLAMHELFGLRSRNARMWRFRRRTAPSSSIRRNAPSASAISTRRNASRSARSTTPASSTIPIPRYQAPAEE